MLNKKMSLIIDGLHESANESGPYYVTPEIKDSDVDFAVASVAKYLKSRKLDRITTEDVIEELRSLSDMWDNYWGMGLRTKKAQKDFLNDFLKRLEIKGIKDVVNDTF